MLNWSFDSQKYFKNNSQHGTQEDAERKSWNCFVSSYILQNANSLKAPPVIFWQLTRVERGVSRHLENMRKLFSFL